MKPRAFVVGVFLVGGLLHPRICAAQAPAGLSTRIADYVVRERRPQEIWQISGRVTTLKGDPVGGAKVRVDVGAGKALRRTLDTNLLGEFQTEFTLAGTSSKNLNVNLLARKAGFLEARETVEFTGHQTWEINLIMREKAEDLDQLSQSALISQLKPRLRATVPPAVSDKIEEFLDTTRAGAGAQVEHTQILLPFPTYCMECRMWMSMALLERGSLVAARRQIRTPPAMPPAGRPARLRVARAPAEWPATDFPSFPGTTWPAWPGSSS